MEVALWEADLVNIANGGARRCLFDLLRDTTVDLSTTLVRCNLTIRDNVVPSQNVSSR